MSNVDKVWSTDVLISLNNLTFLLYLARNSFELCVDKSQEKEADIVIHFYRLSVAAISPIFLVFRATKCFFDTAIAAQSRRPDAVNSLKLRCPAGNLAAGNETHINSVLEYCAIFFSLLFT